ncbi:MAG TPA: AEC family transporter [Burkholderiaceae bacterium]|nr:AEC family transporter [Burkholderiaceae bacterium]
MNILALTGPIYLIIAAGYLSVRGGLFVLAEMRVLGKLVLHFCIPALVFRSLSQQHPRDVLNGIYLLAYAGGSLAVLFGAFLYARRLRHRAVPLAALQGLAMSASNSAFVGYPIAQQLVGPSAGVALALTMIVENLLMMPLALALADSGTSEERWQRALARSAAGLLKSPLILAVLAGSLFALLEIPQPDVFARTIQIVATGATPVALFVVGGSLVGLSVGGMAREVGGLALGKLLLHPLAVLAALWILPPVDPALRTAAVLFAASPMMSVLPVLAQKYHHDRYCAASLLVSIILSFVTINALLWALGALLGWVPSTLHT